MTPHDYALELVALALEDLYMARSTAADPNARDRGVEYHLEQTVEKLLKALLAEKNWTIPGRTVWTGSWTS